MFRRDEYIDKLIDLLKDAFDERLMYIGLQGSYLRNEETKNSDIDIMAVIDNTSRLPMTCKLMFFIMQHLYYLSSGNFVPTKRELLECVQDEDRTVLELSISLKNYGDYDFDRGFSLLFNWCQNALSRI